MVSFELSQGDWYNGLILITSKLKGNTDPKGLEIFRITVEGGSVPSAFHANYILAQKLITLLDQCKFQLSVSISISGMFILVRVLKEILHEDQGDSVARSP